ncbi:conserved membrane protein of unknown function [Tenacibaculum sp. 190130A14a]|uniref:NADPH--hemoprotein reductase n=1 Tax=Tenacibaculum polynesiense TaxID=3137857 RepID=A0ABM9PG90_9FLAO
MTISIWRYSHLTLAISSFIFILIASLTGIILAFEPISNQLQPYAINTSNITLSETLTSLQKEYEEVVMLEVDENNYVTTSVITKDGKNETFYVNPKTGKKIQNTASRAPIYKFATNLHRSLFLKSTGRILVGFFSFLLFLITVTGTLLLIKRQGGIIQFFTKVVKEDFKQFYHVILGRFFLIPIVIITLTGVYLSLEKFSVLPKTKINHQYGSNTESYVKKPIQDFNLFQKTKLSELHSLEFPFSEDEEDYFFLKLKTKEILVHQYSGAIISNQQLSWYKIISNWSLILHTGRGTIVWSLVLLTSCFVILFFIYSGFAITLKRRKKSKLPKNKYHKKDAEFIILVGSESGSTFSFAEALYDAFIKKNKTVFIDVLNNYTTYKKAKHLILLTSTYGEGEAPSNGTNFLKLIDTIQQENSLLFSVVGFGSKAYRKFCHFAIEIDNKLRENNNFSRALPLKKIHNQSFTDFKSWVIEFTNTHSFSLEVQQKLGKRKKQQNFKVIHKTPLNIDDSFLLRLQPTKKLNFSSGDLLAITPKEDNIKRLYSIGKIENDILLSIKKHELGICSNLLFKLEEQESIKAVIEKNKDFHFPKKSKELILIANGTGIAPFLGMLNTTTKTHLFWGGRTKESLKLYDAYLQNNNIHVAYSQKNNKEYVQDLVANQKDLVSSVLQNDGTIMICGSIAMMKSVLIVLNQITLEKLNTRLTTFHKRNQIKTDCY